MSLSEEHEHDWQPPESTWYPGGGRYLGRYRPEDINMRVCACGEVGWLVPKEEEK